MRWIESAGPSELAEVHSTARKLVGKGSSIGADDLVQELAVKDLEKNLAEMAAKAGVPLKNYLMTCLRNIARDEQKKKRRLVPMSSHEGVGVEPESPPPSRGLDPLDRYLSTERRLSDSECDRAIRDIALLDLHDELPDWSGVPPEKLKRMIDYLERRAWILACLSTAKGPLRLLPRGAKLLRRWSQGIMPKAMDLRDRAANPGRHRPLKKLAALAEAFISAARTAGQVVDSPARPGAASSDDLRRVAAIYLVTAIHLRIEREPAILKAFYDLCGRRKRGASARNGPHS